MKRSPSNRTFILVSALVAAVALAYGIANFRHAFPQIAIDFKVSRKTALANAHDFLIGRRFNLEGYRHSISFSGDWQAKTFLEKEFGVDRLKELARDSVDVWFWQARFFKPLTKLEYRVRVAPSGKIIGFTRKLDEDAAGPSLDGEAAQALGQAFISGPMGVNLADWEPVESSQEERPHRRDHTLTYELKGFRVGEAPYRMEVRVQGAEVAGFKRYLKVPQAWERGWDKQRSQNELFQYIAEFFYILLLIAALVYIFRNVKGRQVHWRSTLWLSGILAVVLVLMAFNSLPLTLAGYQTTDSWGAFYGRMALISIIGAVVQAALVLLMLGAGEPLYRRDHPNKLFLGSLLTRKAYGTRGVVQATLMGYILAAFHVGFVVFYYVVGYRLGFWAPAEVKYSDAVSTVAPWIYPLAISMMAAMSEEFMFRFFGIAFLRRLFKSTAVAVVLQAFIWGFLHSAYPQQPGFARGIEVGLIGIVAGVVMLRFGIWATLTWHFVIDATFIGLFLFQSNNAYFWVSGLIVCGALALPAVVAGIHLLRRRRLESGDELLNRAMDVPSGRLEPPPITPTAQPERAAAGRLSPAVRRTALFVGVVGVLLALLPGPRRFGDEFKPLYTRDEALRAARDAVQIRYGVDLSGYRESVTVGFGTDPKKQLQGDKTASFLKRNATLKEAERLLLSPDGEGRPFWGVSFKQEFSPEEFVVRVGMADGARVFYHIIPDSAAGAELSEDSARVLAEAEFQLTDPTPNEFHLIKHDSHKREHRLDHYFTWESLQPVVRDPVYGELFLRREVVVMGDEVTVHGRILKVPEAWERHENESTSMKMLWYALVAFTLLALLIWSLIQLGRRISRREVRWKPGIICGIAATALLLVTRVNNWGTFWMDYNTSKPAAGFLTTQWITLLIGAIFVGFLTVLVVTLADALLRGRYGADTWALPGRCDRRSGADGVIAAFGLVGLFVGLRWLLTYLTGLLDLPEHTFAFELPRSLTAYIPWLTEGSHALFGALLIMPVWVTLVVLIDAGIRSNWLKVLLFAVLAVALAGSASQFGGNLTSGEHLWLAARMFLTFGVFFLAVKFWLREKLWAAMAAFFIGNVAAAAVVYLGWQATPYVTDGWLLAAIAAAAVVWLLVQVMRSPAPSSSGTGV